ncbi:MAG: GGDEF domain-containing protein [Zoogloeaceae bacterium]|nr:GGDEF domain-containing protein [Zoogloeaceae bacterium]
MHRALLHETKTRNGQNALTRRLGAIRFWVFAFMVALGVALGIYSYFDHRQVESNAGERLAVLANVMASNIQSQLTTMERQLNALSHLNRVSGGRPPRGDGITMRDVMLEWCQSDPTCMDLLVVDSSGTIVEWTGSGTPPLVDDREYVTHHLRDSAQRVYLGIPQLSRVHHGRWFFAMSIAERDDDGAITQIYVSIRDLLHSFDYAGIVNRTPASSFAIVSTAGEVYVREPQRELHMGRVIPRVDRVLPTNEGESRTSRIRSRLDDRERLIVTQRLERYPLYVAATREIDHVMANWRSRSVVLGLLWLLLAGIAAYVGSRLTEDVRLQDYLASIDGLTGILNRRALMTEARRHEERRQAAGGLGLMMIDVDHFKRINDRYGHVVGDQVLRQVAATLKMSCRGTDVLGRYGGEEFLLLLPGADEARLATVGEKLRAAIEAIPAIEFSEQPTYPEILTISIGAAVLHPGNGNLDTVIALADQALYQAKNAGRNRVVVASAGGTV